MHLFLLFPSCTTQRPALYESFSLALLQLMSVNIPQSHSQVITDASLPHTHTGWWITIFFVRLISLLCLLEKNQAGGIWACMDVQPLMDEIYFLQMEIKWLKSSCLNVTRLRINALNGSNISLPLSPHQHHPRVCLTHGAPPQAVSCYHSFMPDNELVLNDAPFLQKQSDKDHMAESPHTDIIY